MGNHVEPTATAQKRATASRSSAMADADPLAENWVGIRQPAGISQLLMVDQIFFFKLCHRTF